MCRSYRKYNTSTSRAVAYLMDTDLQCDRVTCEEFFFYKLLLLLLLLPAQDSAPFTLDWALRTVLLLLLLLLLLPAQNSAPFTLDWALRTVPKV